MSSATRPNRRAAWANASTPLAPLGEVLLGRRPGRTAPDEITVFDSSGIGLQGLYLGLTLLKKVGIAL